MYEILVVEDDEIDVMNIQKAFQKAKILNKMHFAKDGISALELLDSGNVKKPLIILLDINMPRMNGIEFLHVIRESRPEWKDTPVVILTTSNAEKDKIEAYNLKIAGYVVKPIDFLGFVEAASTIGSYWSLCEFPH